MNSELIAILGFAALAAMVAVRVPIGFGMAIVGVGGSAMIIGVPPALSILADSPLRTATSYIFGLVPLFILMGAITSSSGMSRELFDVGNAWLGNRRGGMAMGTIAACAGFAAICGSSVATAAAMSTIAIPEMRLNGYSPRMACGVVAAGGTLGVMIPPSLGLALYGVIVEQDIGALFIAGVLPGLLGAVLYIAMVQILAWTQPAALPIPAVPSGWSERWRSLRGVWAMVVLFLFIIGGLYGGMFAPTEAAAMGAVSAYIIALSRRRLGFRQLVACLVETVRTTGSVVTIVIGAILFGHFLTLTQTPQNIAEIVGGLPIHRYATLALILLTFLLLGCVLEVVAMVLLVVPIVYPLILNLGFDPIWFGVIVVMTVELGLITPPVGMNVFVIKSIVGDVKLSEIYRGVAPFILTDIVRLILLIAVPAIATFLPSTMG